jgi:hypothetical protein
MLFHELSFHELAFHEMLFHELSFHELSFHDLPYYQFFAENGQKSQKIVIITSTPGHIGPRIYFEFSLSVSSDS